MSNFKTRLAFMVFMFSIVAFCFSLQTGVAAHRPTTDLYAEDTDINDIGYFDMVEADIYAVLGSFATEYTPSRFGFTTGTKYYYIIPVPTGTGDECYYIGVEASEAGCVPYDRLLTATQKYILGQSETINGFHVHTKGCLKKMNGKLHNYFKEWFEEAQWFESQADLDKYVLPLYISYENGEFSSNVLLGSIIGIVLSLLLFLSMFMDRHKRKKKINQLLKERAESQKYIKIDGISYPKETFAHVNELYRKSKKDEALEELCRLTGMEKIDAKIIIDNWHSYYYI